MHTGEKKTVEFSTILGVWLWMVRSESGNPLAFGFIHRRPQSNIMNSSDAVGTQGCLQLTQFDVERHTKSFLLMIIEES